MISITSAILYVIYLISLYFVIFWLSVLFQGIKDEEKKLKNIPYVTIAIPAYNEKETIEETINSVINLDYPKKKLEIIIINDGSTDNTGKIVKKIVKENKKNNIRLINQKNSGKSVALNNAIAKSKGEFFVCLDADSVVRKDALKKMLPEFEDPDVAIVLPLMKVKNPKNMLEKIQWYEYLINFFYKKLMAKLDCVHVSPGPFSVYRKKVLKELRGFSENNLTEDLEITLRVQKYHYKIVQLLSTEVYTYAPANFKEFYKQRSRWYKGTVFNLMDYKKMIFNYKYGDLGMMHLPSVMLSGGIIIILISVWGYNSILKPFYHKIYDLSFIDYSISFLVKKTLESCENFQILDLSFVNIFLGIVIFILSVEIMILSVKYTKEKVFKYGFMVIPIYLLFYGLFMFAVWFGVLIELFIKKKQKW